ncbi:hypothetical protein DPMN_105443 [Dreissena polymorpha]|uniref:Uncharacterized protein n=1 Tax=Dreissena polymorpha TaxID=45954 RepID=A0A9D4HEQ8_DREPO|nr:hypothetical protein DPMN_105443 [Dreissena polymorpha]
MDVFEGFAFTQDESQEDIDVILQKFEALCVGKTNDTYERYRFIRAYKVIWTHLTHICQKYANLPKHANKDN